MTKHDAVRAANAMVGRHPMIVKNLGPKWDSFHVEYSDVLVTTHNRIVEYVEVRQIMRDVA